MQGALGFIGSVRGTLNHRCRRSESTNWRGRIALIVVSVMVAGCGGGGGGSTTDSPPPAKLSTKVITFSSSAPAAVRSSVTEVLSPVGAGKPGAAALDVPDPERAPAASILAVNERGQILMATTVSGSGELSADSTAMALVFWTLGPEPLGATARQVETQARAAASFGPLVAAVAAAQELASPLTSNADILSKLFAVVGEATTSLKTIQSTPVSGRATALAVKQPSIPNSGYAAIDGTFGPVPLRLTVKDVNGTSAIRVVNTTPLYWAVRTEKQDGKPLGVLTPDSSTADGYGLLKGATILTSVLANVPIASLFAGEPEIDLQDLPIEGFNLRIAQNAESKAKNWEAVVYQTIKYAMKAAVPADASQADKCYLSIANFTVQTAADQLNTLEPNITNLKGILSRSLSNSTAMFKSCAPELFGPTEQAKQFFQRYASIFFPEITAIYGAYESLGETNNVLTLVAQVVAMKKYYAYSALLGICERKGPLGNGTIMACLTSLRFKPFVDPVTSAVNASPTFLVGSKLTFGLQALDGQALTLLPASLKLFNGFPSSIKADLETLKLEATSPGTVALDISDTATELKDSLVGRVVSTATLVADKTSLTVGETVMVRLVDTFGKTVVTAGAGLTWEASAPEVIQLTPLFLSDGAPAVNAKALKASPDKVTISAKRAGAVVGTALISVEGVDTRYWLGTFTKDPCTVFPEGYWFWENPCYNIGVTDGQYNAKFWFPVAGGKVTMESDSYGGLRRVYDTAWNATDMAELRLSFPTEILLPFAAEARYVRFSGTRSLVLNVSRRSATEIGGTYVVTAPGFGAFDCNCFDFVNHRSGPIESRGTGTWSARLVSGSMPITEMNGFDLCYADGGAGNYRDLNSVVFNAGNGNYYTSLGAGGSVAGTCVFGR